MLFSNFSDTTYWWGALYNTCLKWQSIIAVLLHKGTSLFNRKNTDIFMETDWMRAAGVL